MSTSVLGNVLFSEGIVSSYGWKQR